MPSPISFTNAAYHVHQTVARKIEGTTLKVCAAAKMVFEALMAPTRYLGAKTWSIPGVILRAPYLAIKRSVLTDPSRTFSQELFGTGYHHLSQKVLSQGELKPYFRYAAACTFIANCQRNWIEPFHYRVWGSHKLQERTLKQVSPSLEIRENCLFNPKSGLKMALLQRGNELVISFGAQGSSKSEMKKENRAITYAAVANFFGVVPGIYEEADRVVAWIKEQPEFRNKAITLTGQCFGGSLASYCALRHKIPAVCLNQFCLGAGLQAKIDKETLQNSDSYVTNINAQGDVYSDNRIVDALDFIVCRMGIKTPGSFGQRFSVPSAYTRSADTHNYILSSFMKHCGYGLRTKTDEIPGIATW